MTVNKASLNVSMCDNSEVIKTLSNLIYCVADNTRDWSVCTITFNLSKTD